MPADREGLHADAVCYCATSGEKRERARSFDPEKIVDNAAALIDAVVKAKPAAAKGVYMKKISISTTMGPGIRIDPSSVPARAA